MKNLILAITLAAFTVGAFAGEACCKKAKAACADKQNTACAEKAAASCPLSKGKCTAGGETAKAAAKKVQSPKDAANNKS